jgi:hypothetical protein
MSHSVWYDVALRCSRCGHTVSAERTPLYSYGLNPDPGDVRLAPGQTLPLDPVDFDDAFERLRPAAADGRLRALEHWACPVCGAPEYALLSFVPAPPEGYRLESVQTIDLTPADVPPLHLVSRRALDALRSQSRPQDAAVLAALEQLRRG